jgi:hypothetical protein
VHVRVVEAGHDDSAAKVDDLRRGERRLVDADAARDPITGDRECPLGWDLHVEGANQAVLQDHRRENLVPGGSLDFASCCTTG